jgi:thiamine pyrophosphokinase
LISILSLSPISKGVTLKNLKYELNNKELSFDFPLGVSNEFIQNKKATIEVKDGCLLIIY